MKHLVNYSGGIASWATAKRAAKLGGELVLLFADTLIEDEDLYRFVIEGAANIFQVNRPRKIQQLINKALNIPPLNKQTWRKWALAELARETKRVIPNLVWIAEGRNPWQLFKDEKFIGNTRVDLCSRVLKREFLDAWVKVNCDPSDTIQYFGLDANEGHRFDRLKERRSDWQITAPLIDENVWKHSLPTELEVEGIKPPRLYAAGFSTNNCGGACVKAGQAQFERLLTVYPERYAHHESEEAATMEIIGRDDIGILRDRKGGTTKRISLAAFRERIAAKHGFDRFDWGGCGCAV